MGDWTGTVPTILAGDIVTGDDWKNVTDELTALSNAWPSWTPTLTNLTLGNGTQVAIYNRIGKSIDWFWSFTLGSTSAVGSVPTFSLPATSVYGGGSFMGGASLEDAGVAQYPGIVRLVTATTVTIRCFNAAGTYATAADLSSTVPFTWGTGDIINAAGRFVSA